MKKKDICIKVGVSTGTVAKMGKGNYVATEVFVKSCITQDCTRDEIMEDV